MNNCSRALKLSTVGFIRRHVRYINVDHGGHLTAVKDRVIISTGWSLLGYVWIPFQL